MTCNCKAELAALPCVVAEADGYRLVHDHGTSGDPLYWMEHRLSDRMNQASWRSCEDETPAYIVRDFADRLSSPPVAEAELTGWRAKCKVDNCPGSGPCSGWYVMPRSGSDWYLRKTGSWSTEAPYEDAYFSSEAAAIAAINAAAPPPGVEEDKPAPTTGTTNTRPYAAVVADGKAAAPATDREAAVNESIRVVEAANAALVELRRHRDPDDHLPVLIRHLRAHAAGAASAKPRRWPEGRPSNNDCAVLRWHRGWIDGKRGAWICATPANMETGELWLPQPAPPADAKETR